MPSFEVLDEPLLDELRHYWLDRCGDRAMPRRADIDPVDIPHLLPHIALTEVVQDESSDAIRIRYRLAGTEIEARFGCALTNRHLDELKDGSYLDHIMKLYDQVLTQKAPVYSENSFDTGSDNKLWAKRLMLPLSEDQKTVNMVLAGLVYIDSNPKNRATVLHALRRFDPKRPGA